jgi:hypothetical protein
MFPGSSSRFRQADRNAAVQAILSRQRFIIYDMRGSDKPREPLAGPVSRTAATIRHGHYPAVNNSNRI